MEKMARVSGERSVFLVLKFLFIFRIRSTLGSLSGVDDLRNRLSLIFIFHFHPQGESSDIHNLQQSSKNLTFYVDFLLIAEKRKNRKGSVIFLQNQVGALDGAFIKYRFQPQRQ